MWIGEDKHALKKLVPNASSISSGFLLSLAYPPYGFSFLAFFSLVPFLTSLLRESSTKKAALLGLIFGFFFFSSLLYWIYYPLTKYGNLSLWIGFLAVFLLSFILSLYFALFASITVFFRLKSIFSLSFLWIAVEYLRNYLFTGFPWGELGYSIFEIKFLIQAADMTGIYGVGFLVILANLLIVKIAEEKKIKNVEVLAGLSVFLFFFLYGAYSYHSKAENSGEPFKIAVIQGNIDQGVKWSPGHQNNTLLKYLSLSDRSLVEKPDLVVWPETAVPFNFRYDYEKGLKIVDFAKKQNVPVLFGSPDYEFDDSGNPKFFNTAFLINQEGFLTGRYDKAHLVPFGEYVPMKKILPFLNKLTEGAGDFVPGKNEKMVESGKMISGMLVCYEAIFPEISREHVKNGANILINITNDAWYGRTSAPLQHLEISAMRAVENGKYLVRAANTGYSAVVSPRGEIIRATNLFEDAFFVEKVYLNKSPTLYSRYGDWFVFFGIFFIVGEIIKQRRRN